MHDARTTELVAWLTEAGLAGRSERDLLEGFCERVVAAGLPLGRVQLVVDTLHPVYEGRVVRWQQGEAVTTVSEYGRSNEEGPAAVAWRSSPFYHLLQSGESMLHCRLDGESPYDFPIFVELRDAGMTDYIGIVTRFSEGGVIGEMDCVMTSWATAAPAGFEEAHLAAIRALAPSLALAVKCVSLGQIAGTLVETYLGRDAGRRVLSGRIMRGIAERIGAVLWFSDLRGYTRITDTAPPEQIIPLLNDYAEAVISAIHDAGGDVLKLMGDGILAIFRAEERQRACNAALAAASAARRNIDELNRRRAQGGLPTTHMYLGLHVGEVFYGNVGSKDRLDFTVVGPAVNEVSRIAAMCRSADQEVLLSDAFVAAAGEERGRIVSVGRYALRGVGRPQELFTLEPEPEPEAG